MPLPFIMNSVAPSAAIGSQIAGADQMHRDRDFIDGGAELAEQLGARLDLGVDIRLRTRMPKAFLDDADAQSLDAAAERFGVFRDLRRTLPRIEPIRAGQHFQQQRVVAHVAPSSARCDRS